jgi:hypothetical protein
MRAGHIVIAAIAGLALSGSATAQRGGEDQVLAEPAGATAGQALAVLPGDTGTMVAAQTLAAIVTRTGVGPLTDAGHGHRFETGFNAINDNAFATFAGILTQSWNTGANANTQAATNLAWSGRISASNSTGLIQGDGRQ